MKEWNPDHFNVDGSYKFKSTFKPTTLICYRTDALVKRTYKPVCAGQTDAKRGKVGAAPSRRSLSNLVFLLNNCDVPMQSMFTLTMTPSVHQNNSVDTHRKMLKLCIQRMRDKGVNQYVWVREFQTNESVHWHVFTDLNVMSKPGAVSMRASKDWSHWFVRAYLKHGSIDVESSLSMVTPSKDGFVGCVRVEQLRGSEAGRYAGKEGAKRFQKVASTRWVNGGRWWGNSSGMKCTAIEERKVNGDKLAQASVPINGKDQEIAYRIQYNMGSGKRGLVKSLPASE